MPARRYWEMEDAAVNIGNLSAAAEDLGRLMLREFALIYGNDWFQFALPLPTGSAAVIASLTVADTFGVTTKIPHYSAVDGPAANWRLFTATAPPAIAGAATAAPPHALLIPPSAVAPIDGAPIEEVLLLRDELSHMAWGIERTVTGPSGQPFDRATQWNIILPVTPHPRPRLSPSTGSAPASLITGFPLSPSALPIRTARCSSNAELFPTRPAVPSANSSPRPICRSSGRKFRAKASFCNGATAMPARPMVPCISGSAACARSEKAKVAAAYDSTIWNRQRACCGRQQGLPGLSPRPFFRRRCR